MLCYVRANLYILPLVFEPGVSILFYHQNHYLLNKMLSCFISLLVNIYQFITQLLYYSILKTAGLIHPIHYLNYTICLMLYFYVVVIFIYRIRWRI